jgi:hypothetical protein
MNKADSYKAGLSAEIDLLNDIAGAYKKISEAAIQSAKDRAIEKGTKDAADSYVEKPEKKPPGSWRKLTPGKSVKTDSRRLKVPP